MLLINCKIYLEMAWIKNYGLSSAGDSETFNIINAKLYVSLVTLLSEDNVKLTRQLSNPRNHGVKRLFVCVYDFTVDDYAGIRNNKNYFLPRAGIKSYKVSTDGRNFYDQPINDLIKQSDEVRKVEAGEDYDYTTGCLLDHAYFKVITN